MLEKPDNPTFGDLLRFYRERAVDKRARTRLSQDDFATKLSEKTGLIETRNKVSNWETDKTRIAVADRDILLKILLLLHEYGGITSLDEANQLLEAGNYRSLNPTEARQIFPNKELDPIVQHLTVQEPDKEKMAPSVLESAWLKTWKEVQKIFADAKVGPQPSWPRALVALTHVALDRWTIFDVLRGLAWICLWLLAGWLIAPSLRWPFDNQEAAIVSMTMYVGATILLPPCIGLLTSAKYNEFWRQKPINTGVLHLYAYQGAGIGFHLGYFAAFLITLVGYHLQFRTAAWFELAIALFPLVLGYTGAQLVPHNLWRVYGRLHLADGAVFFIFLILGPLWGYFFLNFYSYFLIPIVGLIVILLAAISLTALMAWRQRRTGSTLIPSYWWSLIYGSILVLYEISVGENWYNVTALAGLILVLSVLMALGRGKFTLIGMLAFVIGIGLLLLTLELNIWIGRVLAVLLVVIWWRWEKKFLSLPLSFWVVILADGACSWAMKQGLLSEAFALVVAVAIVLLTILWEWRRSVWA